MNLIKRDITPRLHRALSDSPVVYLNGPRQAGKSTLCRSLEDGFSYLSLDSYSIRSSAISDPISFVNGLEHKTIIDEAQLAPEIFRALKFYIDELRFKNQDKIYGRLILTGSADIMAIPELAESLVGRMQILTLLPFSASEIFNGNTNFIPSIFDKSPIIKRVYSNYNLHEMVQKATFPEVSIGKITDKTAWYENYISTIINRDVKELAEINKISYLPRLLMLLASRAGSLLSYSSLSRDVGLPVTTLKRYLELLQHVYLIKMVQPWFRNISKRLVKSPKIYFTDTALLLSTLGRNLDDDYILKGAMLENFVATELMKHINCLGDGYQLFYFRTSDDKEVDFIIEKPNGSIIGIEVKYSAAVTDSDFNGLKILQNSIGNDFVRGIVLYQGKEILPYGKNLFAMPIDCLWNGF